MDLNGIYRDYLIANVDINKSIEGISNKKIDSIGSSTFENIVLDKLESVNNKHLVADNMTEGMITGEVDDLHEVIIATEEARLSLELAVQLRNKCIEAFREINNMQL